MRAGAVPAAATGSHGRKGVEVTSASVASSKTCLSGSRAEAKTTQLTGVGGGRPPAAPPAAARAAAMLRSRKKRENPTRREAHTRTAVCSSKATICRVQVVVAMCSTIFRILPGCGNHAQFCGMRSRPVRSRLRNRQAVSPLFCVSSSTTGARAEHACAACRAFGSRLRLATRSPASTLSRPLGRRSIPRK